LRESESDKNNLKQNILCTKAQVVFIDTLSRYLVGIDQMDQVQMVKILGGLNDLVQELNVSIILVDHHRKTQNGNPLNPIDDLYGSTGKASQIDTCLGLYREPGSKTFTLKIVSRDNADIDLQIYNDNSNLRWKLEKDPNRIKKGSRKEKIIQAIILLTQKNEDATITKISENTGIDKSNISRDLDELRIRGLVARSEKKGREQPYEVVDMIIGD
jgi:RecA-family ATPase